MGLSKEMHESERGLFALHGITGYLVAVVLLLSILGGLTFFGIGAQKANAEKYYTINQDLNGLKMNSPENHTMWQEK
jgi:hypothetical protein